jgi:integrase/recombinase XerD
MGQFKEKMIRSLKTSGMSIYTQKAYLSAMRFFIGYYMKSPDQLGLEEIQKYHLHLIEDKNLSPKTINVYMAGVKFFYEMCLKREFKYGDIPRMKAPRTVPEILSQDEICKLINGAKKIKHKAVIATMYAGGLRAHEVLHLTHHDIDSNRMMIHVKKGKRSKERYTLLSESVLKLLRQYWVEDKGDKSLWLFPGQDPKEPMSYSGLRSFFQKAKKRAGLKSKASVHNLRHAFATHLLEMGVNIRLIQILLGHGCLSTTAIYTRVAKSSFSEIKNPLDVVGSKLTF